MKAILILFIHSVITLADPIPDTLWTVYQDNPYMEYAADGVLTQDGCYAYAGTSDSLLSLRVFNSAGDEVLSRLYEVPYMSIVYAHSVDQLNDGGFLIAGKSADYCGVFVRTDAAADTLWTVIRPDIYPYTNIEVMAVSDGGYILMYGIPDTPQNNINTQIQKYDSGDNLQWQVVLDSYYENDMSWIGEEADGSLLVAGNGVVAPDPYFIFLVKLDSNGTELWSETYTPELCPYISTNDCCRTDDGGYCIVGHSSFNSIMLKVDADGTEEWRKEFQGTRALQKICIIGDGNIVAGGLPGNFSNAFLFAVNSIGETLWEGLLSIPGHNFEYVMDIMYDESEQQFLVSAITAQVLNGPSDYWITCFGSVVAGFSSQEATHSSTMSISPNPFTFSTEICCYSGEAGETEIAIYDLSGRLVRSLYSGCLSSGETRFNWDSCNEVGEEVPPGMYFCTMGSAGSISSGKLVLTGR